MKTGTRLLILCLLAPAALAENMSLRSGRVLKDAVVVSSGDDFVNIQYLSLIHISEPTRRP